MYYAKRLLAFVLCFFLLFSLIGTLVLPVSANSTPFTDISSSPYADAIEYVYNEGIMNGITSTTFQPSTLINRAMVVTILYRISGSTSKWAPDDFTDVPSGSYYYYAVGWAQVYGIVNGVTETTFCPNDYVTVQQLMTFLYRYVTEYERMSYTLVSDSLVDCLTGSYVPSSYALEPINWAMNCGILAASSNCINPRSHVTRGLCADYLHRFLTLAFGDGKALTIPDEKLSPGYIVEICESMNAMGYDAEYRYEINKIPLQFAFYNSSILYFHTHGESEGKKIRAYDAWLSGYELDTDKLPYADLIYIYRLAMHATSFAKTFMSMVMRLMLLDSKKLYKQEVIQMEFTTSTCDSLPI